MDILERWRNIIEKILQYHARLPYRYGDVNTYVVVSRERDRYLLMHEGWENRHRVHGCIVHLEIRQNKLWIHYDGIEDSITEALVSAGIPKDHIVLAFHPPDLREYTGYAVA